MKDERTIRVIIDRGARPGSNDIAGNSIGDAVEAFAVSESRPILIQGWY
jgi:hypothetical protein